MRIRDQPSAAKQGIAEENEHIKQGWALKPVRIAKAPVPMANVRVTTSALT